MHTERLVYSSRRYDHVTPLLRELHWLRMSQRIDYKLAVFVYRCFNGLAPSYLSNDLQCVADLDARRCLRSASTSTLVVPVTRLSTVGDCALPRLACGTVCRPMSLRRHRCRHSRDGLRQNCLFRAIHSSAASDTLFFTARAARTSFRFSSFCFVRCPSSL